MKVVRSYKLVRDVLYCDVDFLDDSSEDDIPEWMSFPSPVSYSLSLSCIVGPSARRQDDFKVVSKNCPRSVLLNEIILFTQTVKQMYQL